MSPQEWNAFVIKNHGSFLQSWGWGVFQESLGHKVHRLRFDDASGVFAITNAIVLGLPLGQKCLTVPQGPLENAGLTDEQHDVIVHGLKRAASESGSCVIRVDAMSMAFAETLQKQGFTPRRSAQPNVTLVVDLSRSEDALLAAMHPKTRYNIRVAEKHGVIVRRAEKATATFASDIDAFLRLLSETTARDKFSGHHGEYYRRMLQTLNDDNDDMAAELYLAEHGSQVLAGAIISHHGGTATYLHGASSNVDRQVMAPYALHWQIMLDAKKRDAKKYDFWGIAPEDKPSHPWAGITRFKKGFGGEVVTHAGGWELPMPGFWGTVYRILRK